MTLNIHLRSVNKTMMTRLKHEAAAHNMSVNQLILILLNTALGVSGKPTKITHHELDHLAGTWSKKDAEQFLKATKDFEKIDEEFWK